MQKQLAVLIITMAFAVAANAQAPAVTIPVNNGTAANGDTSASAHKVIVGLTFNFGAGLSVANGGNPDLNRLGYPSATNAQMASYTYSSAGGLNLGLNVDLLFGSRHIFGLGAAVMYVQTFGSGQAQGVHVEYEAQDAEGTDFRRLLTAQVNESFSFHNLTIPLLFEYRPTGGKKMSGYFDLGPVISILSGASGSMNATTDYEAVYHYDPATKSFTYSPTTSPGDWLITRQAISSELGKSGNVNSYFAQQYARGYYVGLGVYESGKAPKITYNAGGGAMLRAGGIYHATKVVNVLFGISAMLLSNGHTATTYIPLNAQNDFNSNFRFSSFLNGTSSLLTMQMGVNIGVQVMFMK